MRYGFLLCAAFSLMLTACANASSDESSRSPEDLTERQMEILAAQDLPEDYTQLTPKQQITITRIEALLSALEEKYGEEFVYVRYVPAELMQGEELICYAKSTGSGGGKYLVTAKMRDGTLSDNYADFSVVDMAEDMIREKLDKLIGAENYYLHISPLYCGIKRAEVTEGDFQFQLGLENMIWMQTGEEHYNYERIDKIVREYARFTFDHGITAQQRFEVFSALPEDEPKVWDNDAYDRFYHAPEDLGYYTFNWLAHGRTKDNVTVAPDIYIKEGVRRSIWEKEYLTAEEFMSGEAQPRLVPFALENVTYHGETAFDRVLVDQTTGDSYTFQETAHKGYLRFPAISRMAALAGWDFYTNRKDSFSWRKDGRKIGFRVEQMPFTDSFNPHDLVYNYQLHLEIDGEPADDRLDGCSEFILADRKPQLDRDGYELVLSLTEKDVETLFGLRLIPDQAHWTGELTDAG